MAAPMESRAHDAAPSIRAAVEPCPVSFPRWGDVTGEGAINIIDAQQLARHSIALGVANPNAVLQSGDVTADGLINIVDAQQVARASVGLSASPRIGVAQVVLPPVTQIVMNTSPVARNIGVGVTFAAVPRAGDGADLSSCQTVSWRSTTPAVAGVSSGGSATGVSGGNTYIVATAGGVSDSALLSVLASHRVHGLNFGPFTGTQNPNLGAVVSDSQVRARLLLMRPYARWVRTFGMLGGLQFVPQAAKEYGFSVACGAALTSNAASNAAQVDALVAAANAGHCDVAIVGSETLFRGDLSASQLIAFLNDAQARITTIPVTTVEIFPFFLVNDALRAAVDEIWFNVYPYHEKFELAIGMLRVNDAYRRLLRVAGGKRVVLSESGWPSCGDPNGAAIPSPSNAANYFVNTVSWARAVGVDHFYFEMADEPWKVTSGGADHACFGIMTEGGVMKTGMTPVFVGQSTADNWSMPGGPGAPSMQLTGIPPIGSNDNLRGTVLHLVPSDYHVAVFIRVAGRWWMKPTDIAPSTAISFDGTWEADITTGPLDPTATDIAVFVLPWLTAIPTVLDAPALPSSLAANAVLQQFVTR